MSKKQYETARFSTFSITTHLGFYLLLLYDSIRKMVCIRNRCSRYNINDFQFFYHKLLPTSLNDSIDI